MSPEPTTQIDMIRPNRLSRGVKAVIWAGGAVFAAMLLVLIAFGISVRQQAQDVSELQATAKLRTEQITTLTEQVETLRGQLATKDRQIAALAADNQRLTRALEVAGVEVPELSVQPSSLLRPQVVPIPTLVPGPTVTTPGPTVTVPGPTVTVTPRPTPSPTPGLLCGLLPVQGVTC